MRRRRAPMNRKINLCARRWVGGNPNVVGPIGTSHRHTPTNAGCPPSGRAGHNNRKILQYGRTAAERNGRFKASCERYLWVYGAILTPGSQALLSVPKT